MTLTVSNFFSHYIIEPQSDELEEADRRIALIASIALVFFTGGLVHATVYVIRNCCLLDAPNDELEEPGSANESENESVSPVSGGSQPEADMPLQVNIPP